MADISVLVNPESLRVQDTVTVPTRVYFPSGTVPIDTATIAFDAAWENTGSAVRRKAVTDGRKRGTAAASISVTGTATNPEQMLHAQYVSKPLRAQTISGNVRGQFRALESATTANATIQIGIRVVSKDGQTVRATILAVGGTTTTATTPPEFTTSLTNRRLLTSGDVTPLPLSSYTCVEGDRLVIEIGHNNKSTSTSQTHDISFGDNTVDLPTDDTTTTAQDPWIEFDSTIAFQDEIEQIKISDGGTTQMQNQGWVKMADGPVSASLSAGADLNKNLADAEVLHVQDTLTASRDLTASLQEDLHVVDSLSAGNINQASISEALRIADTILPALDPEQPPILTESVRVQDTVTAMIVLLVNLQETIILDDIGQGIAQLIGVVHISDGPVIAALVTGSDLASQPASEAVHVVDTVTAVRDLTASLTEAVVVQDTVTPSRDLTATPAETLLLAETHAETLFDLNTSISESLKISETQSVGFFLAVQVGDEALRVADTVLGRQLDPLQVAATVEAIGIQEVVSSTAFLQPSVLTESLRIADTLTALMTSIQVQVADESIRITEAAVSAQETTLNLVVAAETLKLSDRVVILSALLVESLRLSDIGGGQTQILGVLKISDTVQAQLGSLLSAGLSESMLLGDVVGATRSPLEPGLIEETLKLGLALSEAEYTRDEYLQLADAVQANITAPSDLSSAVSPETLKIGDTAAGTRTLEVAAPTEAVLLADSVTPSRGLTVVVTADAILLADTPTAQQDQLVTVTEAILLADSVANRTLDPLEASATETLRPLDAVTAVIGNPDDLSTALQDERLLLADPLTVNRDLVVDLTETLRVSEVLDQGYGETLHGVPSDEALLLADVAVNGIELRAPTDSDDLSIGEELDVTLAMVVVIPPEGIALVEPAVGVGLDLATDTIDEPVELVLPNAVVYRVRAQDRTYRVRAVDRVYRAH